MAGGQSTSSNRRLPICFRPRSSLVKRWALMSLPEAGFEEASVLSLPICSSLSKYAAAVFSTTPVLSICCAHTLMGTATIRRNFLSWPAWNSGSVFLLTHQNYAAHEKTWSKEDNNDLLL